MKHDISIIAVGERPTILTEYSTNRVTLQKGIDRLWSQTGSGAYLLDAIIEVCQGLKKRGAARPVIVAVTTEGPDFSNRQHDQVLDPLRAIGAALHVITLGQPSPDRATRFLNATSCSTRVPGRPAAATICC